MSNILLILRKVRQKLFKKKPYLDKNKKSRMKSCMLLLDALMKLIVGCLSIKCSQHTKLPSHQGTFTGFNNNLVKEDFKTIQNMYMWIIKLMWGPFIYLRTLF